MAATDAMTARVDHAVQQAMTTAPYGMEASGE
jgi:hypothetical protein